MERSRHDYKNDCKHDCKGCDDDMDCDDVRIDCIKIEKITVCKINVRIKICKIDKKKDCHERSINDDDELDRNIKSYSDALNL